MYLSAGQCPRYGKVEFRTDTGQAGTSGLSDFSLNVILFIENRHIAGRASSTQGQHLSVASCSTSRRACHAKNPVPALRQQPSNESAETYSRTPSISHSAAALSPPTSLHTGSAHASRAGPIPLAPPDPSMSFVLGTMDEKHDSSNTACIRSFLAQKLVHGTISKEQIRLPPIRHPPYPPTLLHCRRSRREKRARFLWAH